MSIGRRARQKTLSFNATQSVILSVARQRGVEGSVVFGSATIPNRRSFDFVSRDKVARTFAQDDTSVGDWGAAEDLRVSSKSYVNVLRLRLKELVGRELRTLRIRQKQAEDRAVVFKMIAAA